MSIEEIRARLNEIPEPDRKVSPWKNWGDTSFDDLSKFILLWFSHDMKGRAELLQARLEEGPDDLGTLLLLWNYQLLDCEFDEALSTLDQMLRQLERRQAGAVQDIKPYFLEADLGSFIYEYEEEKQRLLTKRSRNQRAWPPEKLKMSSPAGPFFGGSLLQALIEDEEFGLRPEECERLISLGIIEAPPPPPVPLSNQFIASLVAAPLDASAEDLAKLIHHGKTAELRVVGLARTKRDAEDFVGQYLIMSAAALEEDLEEVTRVANALIPQMRAYGKQHENDEWQRLLEEDSGFVAFNVFAQQSRDYYVKRLKEEKHTKTNLELFFQAQAEREVQREE